MEVGKRRGGERASHAAFGDFGSQILVNDVRMLGGGVDGRPRLRNVTFDGISLLEVGNTNKSISLAL